ncbi:hypothetical protein D7Y13_20695 [Corallococcus praedator]|uniref:YtxH domain-containing protein n=1 Tax=Corallococcus praedator TaxID=2316724 RepID=A0ABX9QG25_9BACT|nr:MULTISPECIES: hypothetical protein [Corallococcus]RKH07975.1 hypothetical protein D7X74_32555 [Corallococcus sp. CA047B]RKH29889.1 hypothetical protein D7X75_22125 [Corallococcus sp. CA031C]RKI06194.1 hypothetical protein D7Y13_20695 [Corallococcus praedator]
MGVLKFLVWTACAVGLGVFLARGKVDGRSPLEHMERTWKRSVNPSTMDKVKDGFEGALDDAKQVVSQKSANTAAPRERITEEDRAAINNIIAKKK